MKALVFLALAAMSSLVFAEGATKEENPPPKSNRPRLGPEKTRELLRRATLRKNGGQVRRANSAKGTFVVLNAQKTVVSKDLQPVQAVLDRWFRVQSKVADSEVDITSEGAKDAIEKAGGVLGVVIVERSGASSLVTAPENGWSIVDVAALKKDGPDAVKLAARVRKEILRAFMFVTGGAYMSRTDMLMRNVRAPADLDAMADDRIGFDIIPLIEKNAPYYGLVPWYQKSYRKACEEGWASNPTNEFQKAIWDEIHALPSDPIKIKYDPKRDK